MKRCLLPALVIASLLLVAFGPTQGGDKTRKFFVLPPDVYKTLTDRSVKAIEDTAKAGGEGAAAKIDAEAVILAGYSLRTTDQNAAHAVKMRNAAVSAGEAARKGDVKALTEFGKVMDSAPKASADLTGWLGRKESFVGMMEIYRNKSKGGEGIHADLQYQPKLKNQNGIEALIGALGTKKLSAENLDKVATELPRLSYRIAVTGDLTRFAAPAKGKERWTVLSVQMRDAGLALAESAQKKDADGIQKAAESLQNSCTECHREFRGK